PLQRLSLTPMVEMADPVGEGRLRADLWFGYSNIFEQDSTDTHNLYLDLERLVTALTVRYGVNERLEVGARATMETTHSGFLDSTVDSFHRILSLGNGDRDRFPQGAFGQRLERGGELVLDVEQRGFALEDVRLFAKWLLYRGADRGSALSVRGVARIPTQDNRVGSERSDVGLMLLGRRRLGGWHLHSMLGAATVRRAPELRDLLEGSQYFAMVGVERPFSENFSGLLQFTVQSPLVTGFDEGEVDGHVINTVFGVAWRTGGGWRWEIGFQEDTPPERPSVDFTLQVGVSRSW
ncbi:MAG: DUF3187 family protein, partial [Longimicrobiales bacterium]|nr:DUF3187 family protein [Longimicrobiales bacterium]